MPISQWFEPELAIPQPDALGQADLPRVLEETIQQLFSQQIVLDFTDHLTDHQLYCIIYRDILPSYEKKLQRRLSFLHWDCANTEGSPDAWLRYYASEAERHLWAMENDSALPPSEEPPFQRDLPRAPM